jgi:hypothetical protein
VGCGREPRHTEPTGIASIPPSDRELLRDRPRIAAPRLNVAIALAIALACSASTARAQVEAPRAGTGVDALSGVHEVPLALPSPAAVNTRLGLGYGWTEAVLKMSDSHHRLQLDAAVSVTPLPWLSAALRVLGRYDTHSGRSSDDGVISETHLAARATFPLNPDWHAGAQLELYLPGGDDVTKAFAAVSGDLQLLLAYAPQSSPLTLGLALGLRVDRSRDAGGDPSAYSAADRLALGASDSVLALRPGLAFGYRTGALTWIAEWAYRMYFDYPAESPMWIRAGARYRPSEPLQLELLLGASPSRRPSLAEGAPLRVVEPRLWVGLAVSYAFGARSQPSAAVNPRPAEPAPPPPPQPAQLRGTIAQPSGAALSGAAVKLQGAAEPHLATSDAQGAFAFEELPAGPYTLSVSADGFVEAQRSLNLHAGERSELRVALERDVPQGQIRGTVRQFNGKPVQASISIAQLNIKQNTREDGTFEIDVPPGEYSVAVKARGFKSQTRKARVELRGVAILIVELEVGR